MKLGSNIYHSRKSYSAPLRTGQTNLNNTNYATLQSANGSLNLQSQELHFDPSSAGKGFSQGMGVDHGVTPRL